MAMRQRIVCRWLVVAWLLASFGMLPVRVGAATLTVTNLNDSGAGSLRQAIADAAPGDTIQFQPGVTGTITLTSGTLTLTKDVTIMGPGAAVIAVDGGCTVDSSGHCTSGGVEVMMVNTGVTASINGLTIQHGNAGGGGGGISNLGKLTVANSAITANTANGGSNDIGGGGVRTYASSTLTVTNSMIAGNVAIGSHGDGGSGGGIGTDYHSSVSLVDSTIADNIATGSTASGGGGLYVRDFTTATLTNITLRNNSADHGGGMYILQSTVMMSASTLSENTADSSGGGIACSPGTLTITNSTVVSNSSNDGGGIDGLPCDLTVRNSTFSSNSAARVGGTGGIVNEGTSSLTNTIVAANRGGNLANYGRLTGNNNLIDDQTISFIAGSGNINQSALLGTLGKYGGPTQTIPLLPGSPALGTGAAVGGNVPNTDQRGVTRPQGAGVDIGAFEARFTLSISGGNNQSTTVGQPFAQPLVVTFGGPDAPATLSGIAITFTPPYGGSSATLTGNPATTDASGQASVTATANTLAGGPYTVTATSNRLTATFTLANTPGPAASITASAGTPQHTTAGTTFPTALAATVTDSNSNPAGAGVSVTFTVVPASGADASFPGNATTATVTTDVSGIATAPTLTANTTPGAFTVTANLTTGPLGTPATFSLTNDDTSSPTFQSLAVSPSSVVAGNTVTVTARITDDSSGVAHASICYTLPTGQAALGGACPAFTRIAGTPQDGMWQVTFTVPPTSALGTWTVKQISADDVAGNSGSVQAPAPPTSGGTFTVVSASDITPPTVQLLSVSPTSVIQGNVVAVTARITDDSSGVADALICYTLPNGMPALGNSCPGFARISVNPQDGMWQATFTVPLAAVPGTWTVSQLNVHDGAGNNLTLRPPTPPTPNGAFTVISAVPVPAAPPGRVGPAEPQPGPSPPDSVPSGRSQPGASEPPPGSSGPPGPSPPEPIPPPRSGGPVPRGAFEPDPIPPPR